ncbi:MAG: hypothetical protein ACK4FW_04900, partial [Stenotrophomonas sp.]
MARRYRWGRGIDHHSAPGGGFHPQGDALIEAALVCHAARWRRVKHVASLGVQRARVRQVHRLPRRRQHALCRDARRAAGGRLLP